MFKSLGESTDHLAVLREKTGQSFQWNSMDCLQGISVILQIEIQLNSFSHILLHFFASFASFASGQNAPDLLTRFDPPKEDDTPFSGSGPVFK